MYYIQLTKVNIVMVIIVVSKLVRRDDTVLPPPAQSGWTIINNKRGYLALNEDIEPLFRGSRLQD